MNRRIENELFSGRGLPGRLAGADNARIVNDGILTVKGDMDGREHRAKHL